MLHTDLQTRLPAEGFYTTQVKTPNPLPVRTFLPNGYEPRYAYPLVVFFHGVGGNEEQILRLAPRLSRRNFICISLRGPEELGIRPDGRMGYTWGDGMFDGMIEDYLLRAVQQTRRQYNVHSERIYLAGFGEGATLAYRLGLMFPDRLGGVVSLNGTRPRSHAPLLRLPEARQLRVFIAHGIANAIMPLSLAKEDYRLYYAAGMDVTMQTYPTNHQLHPDMMRDVNRWIVEHCNG